MSALPDEVTRMKSPDPASLQNLNDIVLPASVGWWPLATGWYVVFGLLLIAVAWFGYRSLQRWKNNRYRRTALQELQLLADSAQNTDVPDAVVKQVPILLKRTALSAYPRSDVASLTGEDWHRFLDSKLDRPLFNESVGQTLDKAAYSTGDLQNIDPQATADLFKASRLWLQGHRA